MRFRDHLLIPLGLVTIACGDDAPVGIPVPCVGTCVATIEATPQLLALTPGESAVLEAQARTADGQPVAVEWSSANDVAVTDRTGRVTAVSPGKAFVHARAATDSTALARTEIWVVDPDTSSQPFIAAIRDAVSGESLVRWKGFAGRDSLRLTFSYMLGRTSSIVGAPALRFEIRRPEASTALRFFTVPIGVRGRGGSVDLIVHLTQKDSSGVRLLPAGAYDFYVLLPLSDGRRLGDETGYRVTF